MRAFFMRFNGQNYLTIAEDAVEAAKPVAASLGIDTEQLSVSQSILLDGTPKAFRMITDYGGVLLTGLYGNHLGSQL